MLRRSTRKRTATARASTRSPITSQAAAARVSLASARPHTVPKVARSSRSVETGTGTPVVGSQVSMVSSSPSTTGMAMNGLNDATVIYSRTGMGEIPAGNNLAHVSNISNVPEKVASVNDDISINVSQSVKDKIIQGEYVDLSILLNNTQIHRHSNKT